MPALTVRFGPRFLRFPRVALLLIALAAMARTPNFFELGTLSQVLTLASIVGVLGSV